jgi:hypothetical protein
VISNRVRPGVPRPQDPRERLPRLIRIGEQRMKPEPAPAAFSFSFSFSECAVTSVASRSIVNRSGARCNSQNPARARACAARSPATNPGA